MAIFTDSFSRVLLAYKLYYIVNKLLFIAIENIFWFIN